VRIRQASSTTHGPPTAILAKSRKKRSLAFLELNETPSYLIMRAFGIGGFAQDQDAITSSGLLVE
jgi:hypothetical protein